MYTKVYWIHAFTSSARLGIMPRPRGNEWLEDEILYLKRQNVAVLVSLLERDEIEDLGLESEQQLCEKYGLLYINFPIPDRDIPKISRDVDDLIKELSDKLCIGLSVVIHCRMGIGRSSIIAASVILQNGDKAENVIRDITRIRGLKVPDTSEQLNWLKTMEK